MVKFCSSSCLALNNFIEFCWILCITIVMYIFINFVYYNFYLYEYFLSIFVIECFILPNRIFFYIMNIHIYNLFYICTLACIMSFVPENKLIPIRNDH